MMSWLAMGGAWMYAVILMSSMALALGFAAVIAIIASAFVPRIAIPARLLSVGVLFGALCTAASGFAGMYLGWQQVELALAYVSPDQAGALAAQGWYEASIPGYFGAMAGAGVGLFGLILLAASFAAPRLSRSE